MNRTHGFCQLCNYERLHGEGSVRIMQQKQASSLSGGKKPIRKKSQKQEETDEKLKALYEQMAREVEMVCTGCGSTKHISHSHIIRRSWSDDFETVRENITYHCLVRLDGSTGCHDRWEDTRKRIFLKDYQQNMDYIKSVEPKLYWQIFYREKEYGLR